MHAGTDSWMVGEIGKYKLTIACTGDPWSSSQHKLATSPVSSDQHVMHQKKSTDVSDATRSKTNPCVNQRLKVLAGVPQDIESETLLHIHAQPQGVISHKQQISDRGIEVLVFDNPARMHFLDCQDQ